MAIKMEKVVKTYYEALEEGKIMGKKCPECGTVQFPPRIVCNECGCMEQEWVEMSGKAELTDVTMPSRMTGPFTEVFKPFVMGCIRMEEGPELNGIVLGVTPDMEEELKGSLPRALKAVIFQLETYKTVVFELV